MAKRKVFKFGGASIKNASSIKNIATLLNDHWSNGLIIVVSAAGNTTDVLEKIIFKRYKKEPYASLLSELKEYHFDICHDLFTEDHPVVKHIHNDFLQLSRILEDPEFHGNLDCFYDQVISYGELISTRLLQELLCEQQNFCLWQDARELIYTDSHHKMAKVDWVLTMQQCRKILLPKLDKFPVVTQGFIGRDLSGRTTTLGREGSDFSAAIFAVSLSAESVTIWKDVEGILNGDPDLFPDAVKFGHLDFKEAAEMTYFGASVIHPKTIKPLAKEGIPLYVKSFLKSKAPGTTIGHFQDKPQVPITVVKKNQTLITFSVKDLSLIGGFHFEEIYHRAKQLSWHINLIQASAISISICIDSPLSQEETREKFKDIFLTEMKDNLILVTVKNYLPNHPPHYRLLAKKIWLENKSTTTLQLVMEEGI